MPDLHDHEHCITPDGVIPGCPDFDPDRERTLVVQNLADAEWDRAQRTGVTSHKKCPDCAHRIFEHDNAGCCEAVRCCRDCDCDRYARVF